MCLLGIGFSVLLNATPFKTTQRIPSNLGEAKYGKIGVVSFADNIGLKSDIVFL